MYNLITPQFSVGAGNRGEILRFDNDKHRKAVFADKRGMNNLQENTRHAANMNFSCTCFM